ncbi:MarC family protein [[Phormidium ambiguum] IAM M-71]|uniref:MarC family protein n=1 Tax=[Phormidium ambiguum] IAM M-71 TaxID=454136 RepID=UPI000AB7648F|nr:MarC family protein [Phormidium ambiguum]
MVIDIPIFVKSFVAVFVLADALGNAPIFLVLTKGMEPEQKNEVVNKASLFATAVLLLFALAGQSVLDYLHISMGSLQVAGGLLLLLIALQMLQGKMDEPIVEAERDIAITPLAFPLLAGPGTLTSVMLLMSESPEAPLSVALGIVAAMIVTWLIVRESARIDHLLGAEGAIIITQILGFLLAALAIEIGSSGIRALFFISAP